MARFNVFAYTAANHQSMPPFISINVEPDSRVIVSVRASEADGGGYASAEIPRSEIPDLIRGLSAIVRP